MHFWPRREEPTLHWYNKVHEKNNQNDLFPSISLSIPSIFPQIVLWQERKQQTTSSRTRRLTDFGGLSTYIFAFFQHRQHSSEFEATCLPASTSFISILKAKCPTSSLEGKLQSQLSQPSPIVADVSYHQPPLAHLSRTAHSAASCGNSFTVICVQFALIPFFWLHQGPHPKARKTNSPDSFLQKVSRASTSSPSPIPSFSLSGRESSFPRSQFDWRHWYLTHLADPGNPQIKESWSNSICGLGSAGNIWLAWYHFS